MQEDYKLKVELGFAAKPALACRVAKVNFSNPIS